MAAVLSERGNDVAKRERRWPEEGRTRVPAWVYSDPEIFSREMERIHLGMTWSFVGMECEVPRPGAWKRSSVGTKPVILARDEEGDFNVFENRCSHRGAPVVWNSAGEGRTISCPYHQWTFDLRGNLHAVPYQRGAQGKGGMPASFDKRAHGLNQLRVAVRGGGVFATFHPDTPDFESYAGPEVIAAMDRNMKGRQAVLLGTDRQVIQCNWKAWVENARDAYHATILHTFLTTFNLLRADLPPPETALRGAHSRGIIHTRPHQNDDVQRQAAAAEMPTSRKGLQLEDMSVVTTTLDDYGDGRNMGYQLFPATMYQQHLNVPSFRRIVPVSPNETEIHWTYFGFEDDTPAMRSNRIRQANLIGPAGFVLVEDGEVLAKQHRVMSASPDSKQPLEMGGDSIEPGGSMVTENSLRAFYVHYRQIMGL